MNALRIVSVCLWVLASVHTITGAATTEKMLTQKKASNGYCDRNNNQADSTKYSPDGVGYMNTFYSLTGQENSPAERLKCHEHCISTYNDKFYQILVYTSGTHEGKCYCSIPFSSNCDSNMADETASETWVFVDAYRVVQSDRTKPLNAKPFNGAACDAALVDSDGNPDCTPYAASAPNETLLTMENKIFTVPGCQDLDAPLLNRVLRPPIVITKPCSKTSFSGVNSVTATPA